MEDLLDGTLFALTHLCIFLPTIIAHLTCVFTSFVDDMHIIGHVSNVATMFFTITSKVYNVWPFHLVDEMCNLVLIGIKLVLCM
jgi:hypothetical protein